MTTLLNPYQQRQNKVITFYYVISKSGETKRGLSQINNALRLYLRNQGVVELHITTSHQSYSEGPRVTFEFGGRSMLLITKDVADPHK